MKRFTIILITLLTITGIYAQKVSFEALQPRGMIREGDKFALTFRLNNASATPPRQPQLPGCTFIYGPSTSSRSSYSVVNGNVTSSSSTDYTFTYRADKAGSVTVPAVSISVDGKQYTSKSFQLNVAQGGGAAQGYQGQGSQQSRQPQAPVDMNDIDTQSAGRSVAANDVFVRIILSKSQAYEQEALTCTIKLYTKYQISQFMPTLQPSFDGFLIQELDVEPALNTVESYNGQNYMTAVLKRCILFPQRSGKLTINSGNYDISVVQYERVNMGIMTVSNPVERNIKVSSNKASIDIKPLPQPQPADFSGAVGTFKADCRLVGNTFRTDDAASLIYTISGTGNIKYLKEPQIDFPSEFELYEPQSDIDTRVAGSNVTGTMTVNYTFVPRSVGTFKIGNGKFVYFDPSKGSYETVSVPSFDIKVTQGSGSAATTSHQEITSKNTDILHIHTNTTGSKSTTPVVDTVWYWLLYIVAAGALTATIYANRRRMRLNADIAGTLKARANKVARKQLRTAKRYLDAGDSEHFYEATLSAIWGFLSNKLSIPVSQLSRDNIAEELEKYGADSELTSRLISLLDDCEMARYAPVGSEQRMPQIYSDASDIIDKINSTRKK